MTLEEELSLKKETPANKPYFTTFQLILLAFMAALVVVAKDALRLPVRLPGHSGLFWMAIIIVGAGVVRKRGAASLIGLTSGIMAGFLGLGDFGALNTLLSYTMVGVGTDLALMFLGGTDNMVGLVIAATFGHLAKFLIKWVFGLLTGAPIGFVTMGLAWSAFGYLIWGALGGLLGGLTLRALHKAGFFAYLAEKR